MRKIHLFIPYMTGYGGTETVITNLYSEYEKSDQKKDYQFRVTSIGGYENGTWLEKITKKKIIWLSSIKKIRTIQFMLTAPFLLFKEVKRSKSDVVISTDPRIWFLLSLIKKITRSKFQVFSWYHFSLTSKNIPNFFFKCADGHLAISTGIAKQISEKGVDPNTIKVIFNPILRKNQIVSRTKDNQKIKFGYVGRIMLDGQKNMRSIFDSLAQVKGEWQLDVFGGGDDTEVRNYVKRLGLSKNVTFKGFKDDVWKDIDQMDCLLMASKFEGLPMVLNEAISVGIPVLSYDCPTGPKDIITEKNGLLIPNSDEKAYVSGLQKFCDRKISYSNIIEVKESIEKFYSENYFMTFINAIKN